MRKKERKADLSPEVKQLETKISVGLEEVISVESVGDG